MSFSRKVSEEARRIHYDSIIIDGCSFFCEGYNDNLKASGITALNITVPLPSDDMDGAVRHIADYYYLVNHDPRLLLIESIDDIYRAKKEDCIGIIIGFQNSRPMNFYFIDAMVDVFHRLGTRISILAYNDRNFAADGCITGADAGLSREGRELIREMNRHGIVIDCSHTGQRSSLEAIELSEKPCIFSHSNPKVRSNQKRNITDEQIRRVAEKGGVVGLTPFPPMNWDGGDRVPTLDDFFDSIEYVVDLAGIDHAGIGSDKEATPGAYPRELILRELDTLPMSVGDYYNTFAGNPDAVNLDGFPALAFFPLITQGLLDRGYDEESIRKVLGLNFYRVFKEIWK
ncbi:MAG: membrane dipeptidase [Deltaproteobacteria bacterium]|nr:membrane dipeptidase [Deltaproteobacteria bacterium]